MICSLLAISEFATKLVAGLSGVIFATLIIGIVFGIRNKKPKNINPEELKRKASEQQLATPEESKKSKKKKDSAKTKDKSSDKNSTESKNATESETEKESK